MKPAEAAPPQPRLAAERILVVRLGALGDVVRTRFAFAALRELYPDARIDWLVEDRAAAGLEGIAGLDGTIVLARDELRATRPFRLRRALSVAVRQLRAAQYDLVIDFHGSLKSALLGRATRAPARLGYGPGVAREGSTWLLTHRVDLPLRHVSRFARNAALVRWLGGVPVDAAPPLSLPADTAAQGLPARRLVMHPGTSASTRYKRWSTEGFARVARDLHESQGLTSLVTWGPVPGERETAAAVVAAAGPAAQLAPETRSIGHVLGLMRGASLFVGGDSGPLHLAALVGLPIVAVFGPTDPVENAVFAGVPSAVVRRDVGCNPCRLGCPERACMAAIGPEEVVRAAELLLDTD